MTYLQTLEPPRDEYDYILSAIVGTIISYGWKSEDFTRYLQQLVANLRLGGTLVKAEIEKTDNMFAEMFFRDVLWYGQVPGITTSELRDLLEKHKLEVRSLFSWKGLLIGVSSKVI